MRLENHRKLFVTELQDIYSSEKQILASLPKMEAAATSPVLKSAFAKHLEETREQINRLDRIFSALGENPEGRVCKATQGLIAEGEDMIKSSGDSDVRDAGLIAAAQKIEHYEIASYGTVVTYANMLGDNTAARILQSTLDEEYATDKKLTSLATGKINRDAQQSAYSSSDVSYSSSSGFPVGSILLGAALGVLGGILLAPASGVDSRRKISSKAGNLGNQLNDTFTNVKDSAKSSIDNLRGKVEKAASKASNLVGVGADSDDSSRKSSSEKRASGTTGGRTGATANVGSTGSAGTPNTMGSTGRSGDSDSNIGGVNRSNDSGTSGGFGNSGGPGHTTNR